MHLWEEHLANVIDELSEAWDARGQPQNHLPHIFDRKVVGCIDTFPIEINRPGDGRQRYYYNGKYSCHVVKVSFKLSAKFALISISLISIYIDKLR